ncbi:DUF5789 family protein [Halococcus salifodinae]|uniref:DUF2795 domain-containing protein n=1 Tax=Halococcus salifodinae DSM 8989 TaxID=1227456 RepID=M0N1Z8_9EURY|nr:hypothetical protein [Halococcus salifodinae]EMA51972.1 hypothetical protein C450_11953 [Halococcus salifodinae DSM 8989]
MGERDTDKTREQGVEFGPLANRIDNHSYPATSTDLIEDYGDYEVELPDGTQTLENLFEPLQGEEFDSAEDARQAVLNMVDDRAIGRKGYSDRSPPAPGEETDWEPESI